jgi:hypothetical protein
MFNKNKKIPQDKLEEIRRREILVREHLLIAESLDQNKKMYLNGILRELGYDDKESYNINLDNGKVEIAKEKK